MLLGDGSRISVGVEVAFRRHVLKTNPIAGFDQFDRRSFLRVGLPLELLDQPNVVFVLMAVRCHL